MLVAVLGDAFAVLLILLVDLLDQFVGQEGAQSEQRRQEEQGVVQELPGILTLKNNKESKHRS